MKQEKSKIAFTNDIIKEAAKELDISTDKVREVYDAMMTYLKFLTDKTDAVAIFIPHLGTLHVKVWFIYDRLKAFAKKPEKLELFKKKKEILDKHLQSHFENSYKGVSRHIGKNSINRLPYNAGKTLEEIEEIQNSK